MEKRVAVPVWLGMRPGTLIFLELVLKYASCSNLDSRTAIRCQRYNVNGTDIELEVG